MLDRVWELRHNVTAYDATYVALAEELDCSLLTADARLANAARPEVHLHHSVSLSNNPSGGQHGGPAAARRLATPQTILVNNQGQSSR